MKLGIDFDNTLVCYDGLFHRLARERGWIPEDFPASKKAIRDHLRSRGEGDPDWQRLQAEAYGPRILEASPFPGAEDFLRRCAREGVETWILSHKTERAGLGDPGCSLLEAARGWLQAHGVDPARASFFPTRRAKLEALASLGCTHHLDDLEETFRDPAFPPQVQALHFDPHGTGESIPNVLRLGSWRELELHLFGPALVPLGGGGNSRLFKGRDGSGRSFVLKRYFRNPADPRDRLGTEAGALDFLWRHGVRCVPEPLARDDAEGSLTLAFIEGQRPPDGGLGPEDVDQALAFVRDLQTLAAAPDAQDLPTASEACFSEQALVQNLHRRWKRLRDGAVAADPALSLEVFLHRDLAPRLEALGTGDPTELPPEFRTLSPSDFGFHNGLKGADGTWVFLDFEYFGWDDPVKLVSDFLLHPAMALSPGLKARFLDGACALFAGDPSFRARLHKRFPLYGLKWCLILLNEFLPSDGARRAFAGADLASSQSAQLAKARSLLARIDHDLLHA